MMVDTNAAVAVLRDALYRADLRVNEIKHREAEIGEKIEGFQRELRSIPYDMDRARIRVGEIVHAMKELGADPGELSWDGTHKTKEK